MGSATWVPRSCGNPQMERQQGLDGLGSAGVGGGGLSLVWLVDFLSILRKISSIFAQSLPVACRKTLLKYHCISSQKADPRWKKGTFLPCSSPQLGTLKEPRHSGTTNLYPTVDASLSSCLIMGSTNPGHCTSSHLCPKHTLASLFTGNCFLAPGSCHLPGIRSKVLDSVFNEWWPSSPRKV